MPLLLKSDELKVTEVFDHLGKGIEDVIIVEKKAILVKNVHILKRDFKSKLGLIPPEMLTCLNTKVMNTIRLKMSTIMNQRFIIMGKTDLDIEKHIQLFEVEDNIQLDQKLCTLKRIRMNGLNLAN